MIIEQFPQVEVARPESIDENVVVEAGGIALLDTVGRIYDISEISKVDSLEAKPEIVPSLLDTVTVGEYGDVEIFEEDSSYTGKTGRYIHTADSLPTPFSRERLQTESAAELMRQMGFKINEGKIDAIPSPQTVVEHVALAGVDIELINQAVIPAETYLGVFKEGKYPVSAVSEEYYAHDIGDDHLTAMILGGEPLKDALKGASGRALASDDERKMRESTMQIDLFTASLRRLVSTEQVLNDPREQITTDYSHAIEHAHVLGITANEFDSIIENLFKNAGEVGIVPKGYTADTLLKFYGEKKAKSIEAQHKFLTKGTAVEQ